MTIFAQLKIDFLPTNMATTVFIGKTCASARFCALRFKLQNPCYLQPFNSCLLLILYLLIPHTVIAVFIL